MDSTSIFLSQVVLLLHLHFFSFVPDFCTFKQVCIAMSQRIGMVDIAWMAGQQNERMRGEAEAKEGELAKERLSFLKINRASLLASEAGAGRGMA